MNYTFKGWKAHINKRTKQLKEEKQIQVKKYSFSLIEYTVSLSLTWQLSSNMVQTLPCSNTMYFLTMTFYVFQLSMLCKYSILLKCIKDYVYKNKMHLKLKGTLLICFPKICNLEKILHKNDLENITAIPLVHYLWC